MIRRPPRSTHCISSAASDVYKRQYQRRVHGHGPELGRPYDRISVCEGRARRDAQMCRNVVNGRRRALALARRHRDPRGRVPRGARRGGSQSWVAHGPPARQSVTSNPGCFRKRGRGSNCRYAR
eukprot:TRINITY_DN30730_c0_g1_i1.p5 TRINITY_DN30730_c0_g1~~TRINITY_DN30730_c0_g1_i1.p5  ORF type:complete len:124 (+),score=8.58 TRINITY_DN30730_c0_g1_i1:131-502(+)